MLIDVLYFIVFIVIGLSLPDLVLMHKEEVHKKHLRVLLLFHFLIGIAYFFFTRNGGGDAWGYWTAVQTMTPEKFFYNLTESKGTYFMQALNYIPGKVLGMSFFANTMFFSLIGYIGLFLFYLTALETIPYNVKLKGYKLFPLILFIPNLHFWSAGVGKDTLLFFCIGMFVYGMLNVGKRFPLLLISFVLSYFLRPHITLFLFVGFAAAFLFDPKVSGFKRILLMILLIGASIAILPSVMEFAKIEEASVSSFGKFSENKAEALSKSNTGSAIDISSYPFPLKVLTFLYRPFFFDVRGITGLVASFENLILLILTFQLFKSKPIETFMASPFVIKGLLFFLLIGTLAFSQSLGNVGIMIRMRNMFLPGLLIYILWSFSYQRQLSAELKKRILKKKIALTPIYND